MTEFAKGILANVKLCRLLGSPERQLVCPPSLLCALSIDACVPIHLTAPTRIGVLADQGHSFIHHRTSRTWHGAGRLAKGQPVSADGRLKMNDLRIKKVN